MFNFTTNPDQLTAFWAMGLGGLVMFGATLGTDQGYLQRYFGAKSLRERRWAVLTDAMIAVPVSSLLYVVWSFLFVYYDFHPCPLLWLKIPYAVLPFFVVH